MTRAIGTECAAGMYLTHSFYKMSGMLVCQMSGMQNVHVCIPDMHMYMYTIPKCLVCFVIAEVLAGLYKVKGVFPGTFPM